VQDIRRLLYDEGFKIAGARKQRKLEKQQAKEQASGQMPQMNLGFTAMSDRERLTLVQGELRALLELIRELKLDSPAVKKPSGKKMAAQG